MNVDYQKLARSVNEKQDGPEQIFKMRRPAALVKIEISAGKKINVEVLSPKESDGDRNCFFISKVDLSKRESQKSQELNISSASESSREESQLSQILEDQGHNRQQ